MFETLMQDITPHGPFSGCSEALLVRAVGRFFGGYNYMERLSLICCIWMGPYVSYYTRKSDSMILGRFNLPY